MRIEITLQEAMRESEAFQKLEKYFNYRSIDCNSVKWYYDWCVGGKALNIDEFLDVVRNPKPIVQKSIKQRLDELKQNIHCSLYGVKNRFYKHIPLNKVPQLVLDYNEISFLKDDLKSKIPLTDDEKNAYYEQLQKHPGFIVTKSINKCLNLKFL